MPLMVRSALPVLVMVSLWMELPPRRMFPKSKVTGETLMAGAIPMPVMERPTVPVPAPVNPIAAVSEKFPEAPGRKLTLNVVVPFWIRVTGSADNPRENAPPVIVMSVMVTSCELMLVMVTCWVAEFPTGILPKSSAEGVN